MWGSLTRYSQNQREKGREGYSYGTRQNPSAVSELIMSNFEGSSSVQEYNLFPHLIRECGIQA